MTKKLLLIIAAIVIIVVGGTSFYGGMIYGKNQSTKSFNPQNFRIGQAGNRNGNGANVNFLTGDIISKDDSSVTIKLRDGGSKIVFYSDTTEISKFASGTISDLEVGKSVSVQGQSNSDGSVTSQTIQIRPPTQNQQ